MENSDTMAVRKSTESAENYLETILMLKEKKGMVRSIDIVHQLDFSKPSVSHAVGLLKKSGHIVVDQDGWIELTESGLEIAKRIYERHLLISKWLVKLGIDPETAEEEACKIEHDISSHTFEVLKAHIEKDLAE